MPRERTTSLVCTWPSCQERGLFAYANNRELADVMRRKDRYRCVRHSNDGRDVLTSEGEPKGATLVVIEKPYGKFWQREGADDKSGGSGYAYGEGFQAFADDWPVGTRLVISAVIEGGSNGTS